MAKYSETAIKHLCERLGVESVFFTQCLQESVIEIHESEERLDLMVNGTALRLRRLERICHTFNVDVTVGVLLLALTQRVSELEKKTKK